MTNPPEQPSEVERVARAIARASIEAAEPKTGRLSDEGIEQLVEYFSIRCYPEARAAIEAMRTATPAPCAAPSLTPNGGSVTIDRNTPAPVQDDGAELRNLAADLCRAMRVDVGQITLHWAEQFLREHRLSAPTDTALVEALIIDAIEAQFDIHAMEPEDWAEMHSAIRKALAARGGDNGK